MLYNACIKYVNMCVVFVCAYMCLIEGITFSFLFSTKTVPLDLSCRIGRPVVFWAWPHWQTPVQERKWYIKFLHCPTPGNTLGGIIPSWSADHSIVSLFHRWLKDRDRSGGSHFSASVRYHFHRSLQELKLYAVVMCLRLLNLQKWRANTIQVCKCVEWPFRT